MGARDGDRIVLHATTVAFGPDAVVICGPSGSGKSALGLRLMALGAALVADDRTLIVRRGEGLVASAPPGLPALIEARGIGLLNATLAPGARVALIADLGAVEIGRLPPRHSRSLLGIAVEAVHGPETGHFPAAIVQYIKAGRQA